MLIPVALRKESVDRNFRCCHAAGAVNPVALRKESVDRNFDVSLNCKGGATVALRKESVDRNREQFKYVVQCRKGRSPQGERG